MRIGRGVSALLVLFGVWTWVLWPTFLRNIWGDDRSWDNGATGFFLVHLALTVVSFVAGTAIGWLGVRGLRATRRGPTPVAADAATPSDVGPAAVPPAVARR